ncbi:type II toxin-antitoxin system PemK/MazF family toxin [soil metagenome]
MTDPHRAEIWWADVPGDKTRPVLILTRERFVAPLNSVLVAPLTTAVRDIPTEVLFTPAEGLPRTCAANFDNLFTLRKVRLREFIAAAPPGRLDEICRAYRFAAGC